MSQHQSKDDRTRVLEIIRTWAHEDYINVAGPDWPSYDCLSDELLIPDFVVQEILSMCSLPDESWKSQVQEDPELYVEFYITNVCNLTCSDCRSFNNFNYTGFDRFDSGLYSEWAKQIKLGAYVILGGEPLLHPHLAEWVQGLRALWPDAWAKLDSNGTYVTKVKNLHQLLLDNKTYLCINLHDKSQWQRALDDIEQAFGPCAPTPCTDSRITFDRHEDPFQGLQRGRVDIGQWFLTSKGLPIHIRPAWTFQQTVTTSTNWQDLVNNTVKPDTIYSGDYQTNHERCWSAYCHVMKDGKIFKCATMATLPDFLEQKGLTWPDARLYDYQPVTVENYSHERYQNLSDPIPQCAFCPTGTGSDISNRSQSKKINKNYVIPIVKK